MRKKHFLIMLLIFTFFFSPLLVKANFGDVRYEITDVDIKDSTITFKGWAFIHRTNNYVTVYKREFGSGKETKEIVKSDGGQKILIQVVDNNEKVIDSSYVDGSNGKTGEHSYNFYCELFYSGGGGYSNCERPAYNNDQAGNTPPNVCTNKDNGVADNSQCYYEDMYFEIEFDTSKWGNGEKKFKIAVSNNDFESKKDDYNDEIEYQGDYYTKPESIYVGEAAISTKENNYFKIGETATQVKYIASSGILRSAKTVSERFGKPSYVYAAWNDYDGPVMTECNSNYTYDLYEDNDDNSECLYDLNNFLGVDCKGSGYYKIKVKNAASVTIDGEKRNIACPGDDDVAAAYGSHVKFTGKTPFTIITKDKDKKCKVTEPSQSKLQCNNSGTLESICNELTVKTDKGSAVVKIEQTGTVSSVLTPDRIYAGGGFNFGIMYYNTIKWSYVGRPSDVLHGAINEEMNNKIKDYDSYIAGINITNLKFGDKDISNLMVKKCVTSSDSRNYYDKELTVSCLFTFPDSKILHEGNVQYTSAANSSFDINNKYYTPMDKFGNIAITATIEGMDRITENSSKEDSSDKNNKPWTGSWKDTIEGCQIELYPLYYTDFITDNDNDNNDDFIIDNDFITGIYGDNIYKFFYRPIDINNPFPNRFAGFNWYDWYAVDENKERLENTYSNKPQYIVKLNNNVIADIKKYNKNHNYLEWDSINEDEESSFISNNNYIVRGGN